MVADCVLGVMLLPMEHLIRRDADEHQQDHYDVEDEARRKL